MSSDAAPSAPRRTSSPRGAPRQPTGRWAVAFALLRSAFPPLADWRAAVPAFLLAVASALILRLAYQPFHLSPLAFVALVPLFYGLRRCRPVMGFWVGLLFGALNAYTFTGWITIVARFNPAVYAGVVPLALWLGAHIALALAVIVYFARNLAPWSALGAAMLAWAGMEYFKMIGRLALPYGLLGHSQGGWLAMAQVTSLGGIPLLSALLVGVNLSLMETVVSFQKRYGQAGALARLGTLVALVVAGHIWGSSVIAATKAREESPDVLPVRVALVQTGIPQEKKFASYTDPDDAKRRALQDELARALLGQLNTLEARSADLVVTPESSLTHDLVDAEPALQRRLYGHVLFEDLLDVVNELKAPLVVGGVDNVFRTPEGEETESLLEGMDPLTGYFHDGFEIFGAVWLLRPGDTAERPVADYRKVYLMPFGEAVPYFDLIPGFQKGIVGLGSFARGSFAPPIGILVPRAGSEEQAEVRLGFSICFEDLFPSLHTHHAAGGTQLFVNVTNDAWFDGSAGPVWHAENARWRSIETRIPMVRCTNSGVTTWIDGTGAFRDSLPPGKPGILQVTIPVQPAPPRTLYSRIGNLFGIGALLGTVGLLWFLLRRPEEDPQAT